MKHLWIFGGAVVASSLLLSVFTYRVSLNRAEVTIAEQATEWVKHGNPGEVTFPPAGEVRVYLFTVANMAGSVRFKYNSQNYDINNLPGNTFKDSGLTVPAGAVISEHFFEHTNFKVPSVGWAEVSAEDKCPSKSGGVSVKKYLNQVRNSGRPVISAQCWADADSNPNNINAYNAFVVVLSTKEASVSPSPSPSPSPSASPSPSPSLSPSPSVSPSPSPSPSMTPTQPDTGTPTWLTLGFLVLASGLIFIKLKLHVQK